ncbi:MAG: Mov34/MPN/PAD-1 family protein [Candidatus Hydrothermarchaeales archaeon]
MIVFSRQQLKQLEEHAKRESPNEACGILAGLTGAEKIVKKIYECKNVDSEPRVGYRVDAGDQLRIFEDIDKSEYGLIGFYHSHPMGLDTPSMIDVGRAEWSDYSYVIVSISNIVNISSWIWNEEKGRFLKEELKSMS